MNALENLVDIRNWHKDANYPADERLINMLDENIILQAANELAQLRQERDRYHYDLEAVNDKAAFELTEQDKTIEEARIVIKGIVDFGYEVTGYTMGNARRWLASHSASESEKK